MRSHDLFQPPDLEALDGLLSQATAVVPLGLIYDGLTDERAIGMRHDCDNVILPAVKLARWEWERRYRSTYYILHTSPYWEDKTILRTALDTIVYYGHEIGIHNDALTVALQTGRDPSEVLAEAIEELRGYGHEIRSTVAHGNALCRAKNYVNDELFRECHREQFGDLVRLGFEPVSLAEFGLDFDANWLARGDYLSDSGGHWSRPIGEVTAEFKGRGQLHVLQHPDWWDQALSVKVAA